jgi:hypothetical protein
MKTIIRHINKKNQSVVNFHLIVIPFFTVACKEILERNGVLQSIFYYEIQADLLELTRNVLSMEYEASFSNLILQKDSYPLSKVEKSIQRLEAIYGRIPLKYAKGNWSCAILERLQNLEKNTAEDEASEIQMLILLDRNVDLLTLMVQQYSFEGRLDEHYGITQGHKIFVESNLIDNSGSNETLREFDLNGEGIEMYFNEVRDKHVNIIGSYVNKRGTYIKNIKNESKQKTTTEEIKEFVSELAIRNPAKELEVLSKFTNMWTKLMKSLTEISSSEFRDNYEIPALAGELEEENMINMFETKVLLYGEEVLVQIVRVLTIHCLTKGGISEKSIDRINKALFYSLGPKGIFIVLNLLRAGMIYPKGKKGIEWSKAKDVSF